MAPELNPAPEPVSIMVVEDDILIRTAIADGLRATGLDVVEAASADEAWSFLLSGASVDLIFSDLQMPGSFDGIELARRVKENYPDIIFVLTSGGVSPENFEHDHFLQKPYQIATVVATITSFLASNEVGG